MVGQPVQGRLDHGLEPQGGLAEAADLPQEGASEAVGSEQAVKIASGNPAVGRLRALGAAVGQDQAGPRARSAPSVRPMWIS